MTKQECLTLYRIMLISKCADSREGILSRQGKSFLQVSSRGHEALALLSMMLREDDILVPYWRNKALVLGKSNNLENIAEGFFGCASSSSGGRNMPSHFSDKENNIFSVVTSTGMQCLPACGMAWSFQQRKQSSLVLCSIGEGATRQGEFYEAWCFAKERRLPILFVVEDNKYAISTPTNNLSAYGLDIFNDEDVSYVIGSDANELYHPAKQAIENARQGVPSILWCAIDRLNAHTNSDDCSVYRSQQERDAMIDPIVKMESYLLNNNMLEEQDIININKAVTLEVDNAYAKAEAKPPAAVESIKQHLYTDAFSDADMVPAKPVKPVTIVDAVNQALHDGFEFIPTLLGFGQDVEEPKGGVFGFTKGISTRYPGRISNSPLSEATIVGAAVGLAANGFKPIFEIQFVDFLGPAFEQLVSQLSTLSWRSLGQWRAPVVLYAPYGAYLPGGGIWHSQSNEGIWCHVPGLRVAIPSHPQDVYALFWMAFQLPDPILILLPKHLMRKKFDRHSAGPLRFGCGKKVVEGEDLTIVAWGNCLDLLYSMLPIFKEYHISVELIDPIFLNPVDYDLINESVIKTGRLLVVQEDNKTCSMGESIINTITNNEEAFYSLLASPLLISREDIHIPYHQNLEYAVLPDKEQVLDAVIHMVNQQ